MLQPTTPEQRQEIYKDVHDLLVPGFISHTVDVGPVRLSLRSPGPSDFFLLGNRLDQSALENDWKAWTVASQVWMAAGQTILGDQLAEREVYNTLRSLPSKALGTLFYLVLGLTRRTHEAVERIEAFCYEDMSRYLWRQVGRDLLKVSGLHGSEHLGINTVQQIWISLNLLEDDRERRKNDWECAKLVASVQAYKAIRQMGQQERTHLNHEQQRRQEVMDRSYYKAKGYSVDEGETTSDGVMWKSKSKDELADEYRRWVEGEMDFHDKVVVGYKNKIRGAMFAEQDRIRALNEQYQAQVEDLELPETAPAIVGYTQEQITAILAERNDRYRGGTPVYFEDKKFRTFRRHIEPPEAASNMSFQEAFAPEQSDRPSLDEQVALREREQRPGGDN